MNRQVLLDSSLKLHESEGTTADKVFEMDRLLESASNRTVAPNNVLEFGVGWGRIIRFFLKDIEPANLWGTDCNPDLIEVCTQTNKWCNFELNNPIPPTSFSEEMFDLIYCYSVFSHFSEDIHKKWLVELRRILRTGGLLIVTVRPREFITYCGKLRDETDLPSKWMSPLFKMFPNTEQFLSDYDGGNYCYSPYPASSYGSWWGEACIPKGYVLNHWTEQFTLLDFIDDRNLCKQNVVVMKKLQMTKLGQ